MRRAHAHHLELTHEITSPRRPTAPAAAGRRRVPDHDHRDELHARRDRHDIAMRLHAIERGEDPDVLER